MIIGLGIDLIEIARLEEVVARHGDALKRRVYSADELRLADTRGVNLVPFLAGRWAAKEAVAKALGTGFGKACGWRDISIGQDPLGRPTVTLSGAGLATAQALGASRWHVSISHERGHACAVAIAES